MDSGDRCPSFKTKKFKTGQGPRFQKQCAPRLWNIGSEEDPYILDRLYHSRYALKRILDGKTTLESERALLWQYKDYLPKVGPVHAFDIDVKARKLLFLLTGEHSNPMSVQGDGNCFFRAVSLALFGNENYHCYVRLMTTLEIIEHPHLYNTSERESMLPALNTLWPIITHIDNMAHHVAKFGQHATMLEMYAMSAAFGISFRCLRPPLSDNDKYSKMCTRNIVGRSVSDRQQQFTIMWSSTKSMRKTKNGSFLNHFVPFAVFKCIEFNGNDDAHDNGTDYIATDNITTHHNGTDEAIATDDNDTAHHNGHFVAVHEYKGELNRTVPHGNSKFKQAYVRTDPEVLDNIKNIFAFKQPSQTYRDNKDCLRNRKRVQSTPLKSNP